MTTRIFPQPNGPRPTGTQLTNILTANPVSRFDRELLFESWVLAGFCPPFMAEFSQIDISTSTGHLSVYVSPDYLCFGTDDDYIRAPLFPLTAQRIADKLGCILPTTKIVDEVWRQAAVRVTPQPWGPPYDSTMMDTSRIIEHNRRIQSKLSPHAPGHLIAGHKKDIVICKSLATHTQQVYIYGWHKLDGNPIQPLYGGHENTYTDYSHGLRLVAREANVVDQTRSTMIDLKDVYFDPTLASSVSIEGRLPLWRQPGVPEL